jgi:hypothetical protein
VGVALQDGQVGDAEVAGQRACRQQLAGQVLDPGLVLSGLAGEPVSSTHPPVQRRLLGAGQYQGPQPGRIEQRQPGQGVGVEAVGFGVPRQEPAQVGGLLRRDSEHLVAASGEEHRDRQPRGPGRLDHHLQPGASRATSQCRGLDRDQALHRRPGLALGHHAPLAIKDPHRVCSCNAQVDAHQPPVIHPASLAFACRIPPARPQRRHHKATAPSSHGQPRLPLMCCNRIPNLTATRPTGDTRSAAVTGFSVPTGRVLQ